MTKRPAYLAAIIVVTVALSGAPVVAQEDGPPDLVAEAAELDRNQLLWQTARPAAYTYAVERICFCPEEWRGPVRLNVQETDVTSRVYVSSGDPVTGPQEDAFPPVEGLFDLVADGIARQAHRLDVTYDPDLGVPLDIWIDYDEMIADEEVGMNVTEGVVAMSASFDPALPEREGPAPDVTDGIPHIQLDQTSDDAIYARLVASAFADARVEEQPSRASLPGALGLNVAAGLPLRADAMITGREFAHIHAQPGRGSLHIRLSDQQAADVVDSGWGVWHPFALDGSLPGLVMVFAPRTDDDLEIISQIIDAAIDHATSIAGT